jgi:hypothetical protein
MPLRTKSTEAFAVSRKLKSIIGELQTVQSLLLSDEVDPQILTDFRDALNRVRNVAWSAQQYIALKNTEQDSAGILSLLASERLRATYQLCQALQSDLGRDDIPFQAGQLLQLHTAARNLNDRLEDVIDGLS